MIRDRLINLVKRELSVFVDELHINEYQNFTNDFDHCAENIADEIVERKWDFMYDFVCELLKDNANNNRWGFEVMNDDYISCETETEANVIANFLEDCGCDTIHTYEFPDHSGWLVYPDGL